MQRVLIAYDGTDENAKQRRLAVREAHIALGDELVKSGEIKYGVAILDDDGEMIGSVVVMDFATQDDMDAWLAKEPYVTGKVWESMEFLPCRVGPSFVGMHH
jgi:uncharacterized protein YciI